MVGRVETKKKLFGEDWIKKNGLLRPFNLTYDAVDSTKKRRRAPKSTIYSEDDELSAFRRKQLISSARDLQRNFSVAGWAIRKHLDYVASYNFQVKTSDNDFNKKLEALFAWWSLPANCDAAGKHSLSRFVRLAEQSRTIDGDVLVLLLKDGRMQAVESDRISDPSQTNTSLPGGGAQVNGVRIDASGRATEYAICRRVAGSGTTQFDRWVSSEFAFLLGYFDRFDQVRGVSRMAAAINAFQDLYEGISYALAKAKVSQLFGLITYRDAPDSIGIYSQSDAPTDEIRYDVNFGAGPFHLDLDDGDKAEILESKTPSVEFQEFTKIMIASAIKSLDIPFSFYDESFTNYSGARQALLQYEQSVRAKRDDLIELLDRITSWKIAQWVGAGILELPAEMRVTEVPWEWVPIGMPWIDPQREIAADALAIKAGVRSRQQICKERGLDFFDIADQLGNEKEYLEARGLPSDPSLMTSASKSISGQADGNEIQDDENKDEQAKERK